MGTCVNCKYAGRPTYKSPCSECKGYSKHEAMEIRTNGDRIRAMSDEELAKLLMDADEGNFTVDICDEKYCDLIACPHDCTSAALKWLQQPVESFKEVNSDV